VSRRQVRLHRMWFSTDYDPQEDPEYHGAYSQPFMLDDTQQIVDVDWSVPGEVCVTVLRSFHG
jgi:hypothetical protein